MMGSILPRDIEIFGQLFIAITRKDVKKIIRALQRMSNNTSILNMRSLEFDINEFVEKHYIRSVHKNEMSTLMLELKEIVIEHGLKVPSHFFLFARSLVTIEGVLKKLDPELDQYAIVKPFLLKTVSKKFNPAKVGEKTLNSIFEFGSYMEEFPRDLKNAIRKINSGEVKVDLTHKGIDPVVHTLQRVTKQLVTAFVMVALIISAALFIITGIKPFWGGFSAIGIICIAIAIILAYGMVHNINKGDYDNL
jgi:ubiquinone biosynthesis protein